MSNTNLPETNTVETPEISAPQETTLVQENTPVVKQKKSPLVPVLLLAILIVLLLLLFTKQGIPSSDVPSNQGNSSAIVDGELDLMGYEEIKAGLQSKVDESYMNLKINLNPVFNDVKGKGNLMIQNSSSNKSNIQVSIYLEESNELIYTSPILKPNQSISEDQLTHPEKVTTGTHKALAMFSILNPETDEKVSETGIKITLTVK